MRAVPFIADLTDALPAGSAAASRVDTLFVALLLTSALVVAVLGLVIGYFLVRYRRGSAAPRDRKSVV